LKFLLYLRGPMTFKYDRQFAVYHYVEEEAVNCPLS